ncbi:MAG: DUF5305 domain-containing protein [Halosimplex sp.]
MASGVPLRIRAVLDGRLGTLFACCLVVVAAGAVVTYSSRVKPGTHREQRVVDEWALNGSFSHASTVTRAVDTPFETGAVVRNRSVYFQRVMPVLNGNVIVRTPGSGAPVDVVIERRLVVESVAPTADGEAPLVYWRDTRSLGRNRTVAEPDRPARIPFELNVTRALSEARNASERLGSPGEIRIRLVAAIEATRRVDGARTRHHTYAMSITPDQGTYRVEGSPSTERFTETESVTVPNRPGAVREVGGPLLLFVGLAGLVALVAARWWGAIPLSDTERSWLEYRTHRAEFDEWITTIRLPDEAETLPTAHAETLADLVDFAIDTDSAVVEEPDGGIYHVVHDGYRYTYEATPNLASETSVLASDAEPATDGDAPRGSEASAPLADGDGGARSDASPDDSDPLAFNGDDDSTESVE